MTSSACDRYWREGVLLVEQGVTDLHRESCDDCRAAHAARAAIVTALPMVRSEAEVGRADWKLRVWAEIDRVEARRSGRAWAIGGAFALAAAAVLAVVLFDRDAPPRERYATAVTIEKGPVKKRGGAQVGDRVRAVLGAGDEVRIYRTNDLVLRCGSASEGAGCVKDARGWVALYELPVAGDYTIVIVTGKPVAPVGNLDRDLAALVAANVAYRIEQELAVR